VQKVQVEPNQLAREVDYIRWNMEFTRRAYGLDLIERRASVPRADAATWASMAPALESCRCGICAPLQTAFNEIAGAQRYYQFPDVDYDRYGERRRAEQVAIAVREFRARACRPTRRRGRTCT
jgi:uncharacterized protein